MEGGKAVEEFNEEEAVTQALVDVLIQQRDRAANEAAQATAQLTAAQKKIENLEMRLRMVQESQSSPTPGEGEE